MQERINSVQDLGVLVRATRKKAGVRIDDLAASAGLSKQFVNDLELGKETVQLGKVLQALADLGIYLSADVPMSTLETITEARLQIARTNDRRRQRAAPSSEQGPAATAPAPAKGKK